jgi:hypothetical protein
LQYLEILYVGIFAVDVELDAGHRDIEINAVEDLAESGTNRHRSVSMETKTEP